MQHTTFFKLRSLYTLVFGKIVADPRAMWDSTTRVKDVSGWATCVSDGMASPSRDDVVLDPGRLLLSHDGCAFLFRNVGGGLQMVDTLHNFESLFRIGHRHASRRRQGKLNLRV